MACLICVKKDWCGEFNKKGYICTREIGHKGKHVVCAEEKHSVSEWDNYTEKLE